jgi:hypothetical protein
VGRATDALRSHKAYEGANGGLDDEDEDDGAGE